jgi:alkylation response protein AidB-like acyl-CoA dehydrogenase
MPFDRAARHALFVGRSSITLVETEIVAREQVLDITLPRSSVKVRSAVTVGGEAQHQLFRLLEVLLAAEIVGACERAVELVIGYAQTRKQFGKPIAAFQVVQHDLADIHLLVETFDSMLSIAIHGLSSEAGRSELAVAALLRALERDAVGLVERVIQIHGGIGFTWEHDAHLYLRRVMSQVALLGDSVKDSAAFLSLARLSA